MHASSNGAVRAILASEASRIACLSLCTLLGSLSIRSSNVALPVLAQRFGAHFQAVQWVQLRSYGDSAFNWLAPSQGAKSAETSGRGGTEV
jgi:hypothetical protein